MNFLGASFLYMAAFSGSLFVYSIAWTLLGLNVARVVRSRMYDDFRVSNIKEGSGYQLVALALLFDVAARTYLSLILSLSLACLLIERPGAIDSTELDHFSIGVSSGNLFIDFFYFSAVTLTTLGYGDVTPISSGARLLISAAVIFGVLLLGLTIGVVASIALQFQDSSEGARKEGKTVGQVDSGQSNQGASKKLELSQNTSEVLSPVIGDIPE